MQIKMILNNYEEKSTIQHENEDQVAGLTGDQSNGANRSS
ncbi:hypothetical protein HNR48_003908 [Pseudoteredinibacter isoporae]|uniref:Uncharacterized protein n=1 Tax=Pseudoteredinibacter isoporae TaxID=570281 RepID=A0A7X0MYZ0_9GAMM|nr:hypothetical protein [Pseudoteredinibacter isoporae]